MGGAQPLAATLAETYALTIECQQSRIDFRLRTRYVDERGRRTARMTRWPALRATPARESRVRRPVRERGGYPARFG